MNTHFQEKVLSVTKFIPKGKVATYAGVARKIGRPKAFRAVANVLSKNNSKNIPCHRVVRADGRIGGYNGINGDKASLLKKEGVIIINGRIDLSVYGINLKQ